MGAGRLSDEQQEQEAPFIVGLQPSAVVDTVARIDSSFLDRIPGERGGSIPVGIQQLNDILMELESREEENRNTMTMAGGSVANTIRGLSAAFGIPTALIGACGDDDQGQLFVTNMAFNGVNLDRLRMKKGHTAQCVCLVDDSGNRTMRPCLSNAVKVQAQELIREDFKGSKWLVLRYAAINLGVIRAAILLAKEEGLFVSMDLASFEMVRNSKQDLLELLESKNIDLCFANEDEATELLRGERNAGPEAAVEFLAKYCRWAVVTLGHNGCIAKHGREMVRVPAIGDANATDATGAGDLFASGFLYGVVNGLSLEECCKVGACSGGSVIRSLGGEVTSANRQWLYKQMQIRGLRIP